MQTSRIAPALLVLVSTAGHLACSPAAAPVAVLEAPRVPPPDPRADPKPAPLARASEPDPRAFVGCWLEAAEGRTGCSDTVHVTANGTSLAVTSADCNDGASYVTERVATDTGALELDLRVASNGTRIEYTLRPGKRDTLEGKMKVTIGKDVSFLPVVWRRCRDTDD